MFRLHGHTLLWKDLDARKERKGYGCSGDVKGSWVWYDRWIERVIEHCQQEGERYR